MRNIFPHTTIHERDGIDDLRSPLLLLYCCCWCSRVCHFFPFPPFLLRLTPFPLPAAGLPPSTFVKHPPRFKGRIHEGKTVDASQTAWLSVRVYCFSACVYVLRPKMSCVDGMSVAEG